MANNYDMRRGDMVYVHQTVHDWRRRITYVYSSPYDPRRIEVPVRTPGLLLDVARRRCDGDSITWCQVLFPQGMGWVLEEWLSIVP